MGKTQLSSPIWKVEAFVCYISLPFHETECAKEVFFIFLPLKNMGLGACPGKSF